MIDTTFKRAIAGFMLLTFVLAAMAIVALWSLQVFVGDVWWASIIIVIVAMVAEIGVYGSTIHDPIHQWIKEPERAERESHGILAGKHHIEDAISRHVEEHHRLVASLPE